MSDAFSFMFGFYGLLLGLAVAEVAAGFSRAYDGRKERKLGVVAPLFGVLLLVDLITFWMNAFAYREVAEINYLAAFGAAVIALLYYFAATQIFPRATETETLDDHIMAHRRAVAFSVLASNVLTQIPNAMSIIATPWPLSDFALWAGLNVTYYVLLTIAALAKSKTVVTIAVAAAILFIGGATAIFA